RTHELSTLLAVSTAVASTLELQPLLGLILAQLKEVVEFNETSIMVLEGDELTYLGYYGPQPVEEAVGRRFSLQRAAANRQVIERREPVIIADIWGDDPLARSYRQVGRDDLDDPLLHVRSWLGVPLMHKEQVTGMLGLRHAEPNYYTPHHARLALAIANQAAVAIENARLYARAQELAAVEERARLARELHDSVTQMLFSASVIAEVLPRLWERDRDDAKQHLNDLRVLTRGALAEMRTLLLELRPTALAEAELGELLRQLAEAMTGRTRVPVTLTVDGTRPLPPDVQIALYRLAQEGLNNVARHAEAGAVAMSLRSGPEGVQLRVGDDGHGFDIARVAPGHFGLRIMRERADAIGATLAIESVPGRGTQVVVRWTDTAAPAHP
ncbi:MAG TPA: GAF domain-containing sensor histidine kinase, partial [Chloroflexota bacterium]|nr:GAF domain-containing sensor histidine kinase [Chloroflexota bacterium]